MTTRKLIGPLVAALLALALVGGALVDAKPLPGWDVTKAKKRFKVLKKFSDAAVLDLETGLVWALGPDTTSVTWVSALENTGFPVGCAVQENGTRLGWRLPTIAELTSLLDPFQQNPRLAVDHPFVINSGFYWSSTTSAADPTKALVVDIDTGEIATLGKTSTASFKCVRGGAGEHGGQ